MYRHELLVLVVFSLCSYCRTQQYPNTIRVDGFFEPEHKSAELAFKWTMQKINLRNDILSQVLVAYIVKEVTPDDSFDVSKKVCREIAAGCKVIFGPSSRVSASHVQSICKYLAIPHIQAHWDPRDVITDTKDPDKDHFSLNLYPYYLSLSTAFRNLIDYWKWTQFTVIYEDNDGLIRLQEVLKASNLPETKVTVRKINDNPETYISLFKDLKERGEYRIIIDCHVSRVGIILEKALQVNAVSEYFHYLFTTLDLNLVELEQFKHAGANITAMRLVDPDRPLVTAVTGEWKYEMFSSSSRTSPLIDQSGIPTETALIYDAVYLFARGLHGVEKAKNMNFRQGIMCNSSTSWEDGLSLLNYMKTMDFEGLTGRIHFGKYGERSDFTLDITKLDKMGLKKIGTWDPKNLVNITEDARENRKKVSDQLANKTLIVTTVLDDPYVFQQIDEHGIVTYEGFCIDLLNEISSQLGFKYEIRVSPKNEYGNCNDEGECNGMVKELVERRADLAVAGMTITYERERVIDFTKPFWNIGITILFRKPKPEPPELFSFLSPLDTQVWIYVIAVYLCVSFMMFVIARFTPYEWCNPHPCDPNTDVVENQFSVLNSLWFTIGAFMQQGCEIAPRAVSTRMVAGVWWFFTLIIISSYTANLAAFLTIEKMVSPIQGAEDLAKQTDIKYGTLGSGSTKAFFERSKFPTYQRMWSFMKSATPSVFVSGNKEGEGRVLKGDYAYFAESSTIEYMVERNCELMQVGQWLDSKGYGIALPQDSPYRDKISSIILKLQEDQTIQKFYNTWWKEKNKDGECIDSSQKKTNALTIKNVGGIFVVLIAGTMAGVVVAFFEFLWKARQNAREDKQTLCSEMGEELRFAVRCFDSSSKPVHRKPSYDVTDNGLQSMPLNSYKNNGRNDMYN
uniref:Glutamate receptor 1 n=1 Tax=Crassostrea virginica TaxID=6565 RepID=A0A8B8ASC1_CRAVI|nr:glutamate receptor ionotropic, kainate 2-like [Crassostrea virginica]XP_022293548.1 glutamate receptor ionotropic, kainate 2-like [Crassostrea virginica]